MVNGVIDSADRRAAAVTAAVVAAEQRIKMPKDALNYSEHRRSVINPAEPVAP